MGQKEVFLSNHQFVRTHAGAWPGVSENNLVIILHYIRFQGPFNVESEEGLKPIKFPEPPKSLTYSHHKSWKKWSLNIM